MRPDAEAKERKLAVGDDCANPAQNSNGSTVSGTSRGGVPELEAF